MRIVTVARKPTIEKVTACALEHGTAALHIDACRISTTEADRAEMLKMSQGFVGRKWGRPELANYGYEGSMPTKTLSIPHAEGRWPANLILQHQPACLLTGTKRVSGSPRSYVRTAPGMNTSRVYHKGMGEPPGVFSRNYADEDGQEAVDAWDCVCGCPVPDLDEQTGDGSRFFKQVGGHEV